MALPTVLAVLAERRRSVSWVPSWRLSQNHLPLALLVAAVYPPIVSGGDVPSYPHNWDRTEHPVLGGVDVVAYRQLTRPGYVLGSPEHKYLLHSSGYDWTFLFSNEENRATFASDPWRYAPQFGGFCAWGFANEWNKDECVTYCHSAVCRCGQPNRDWTWSRTTMGPPAGVSGGWSINNGKLYLSIWANHQDDFDEHSSEFVQRAEARWVLYFGSLKAGPFNTGCYMDDWPNMTKTGTWRACAVPPPANAAQAGNGEKFRTMLAARLRRPGDNENQSQSIVFDRALEESYSSKLTTCTVSLAKANPLSYQLENTSPKECWRQSLDKVSSALGLARHRYHFELASQETFETVRHVDAEEAQDGGQWLFVRAEVVASDKAHSITCSLQSSWQLDGSGRVMSFEDVWSCPSFEEVRHRHWPVPPSSRYFQSTVYFLAALLTVSGILVVLKKVCGPRPEPETVGIPYTDASSSEMGLATRQNLLSC